MKEKRTKKSYTLENDLLTKLNYIILSSKYEKETWETESLAAYYAWINSLMRLRMNHDNTIIQITVCYLQYVKIIIT